MPNFGASQNAFLQVLNTTTASLTSEEQTKLTIITQQPEVLNYWHISIDNFENALSGRVLQATLPNEISTTFEADFPFSEGPGRYYWMGYNSDGSYFQLIKRQDEASGKVYIASTGNYYGFISLSSTKTILVKYDNSRTTQISECGVMSSEEDDDDTVEDRGGCEINNIRVLFLFTPAVAGAIPSPSSVALNAIAELNATSMASGMAETDVHFESAGAVLLPGFIETSNMKNDVDALCDNSTAKSLRNSRYADLVVLLTAGGHTDAIGWAKAIGASDGKAYAGVEIRFANLSPTGGAGLTATHEVGHLLGGRHQRCTTCNTGFGECDILTWYHGFQVGPTWRTMMAQNACPNPTRIQRWSNPDKEFMGFQTGDILNNNSKKIKSRASKVCCFREAPPETGGSSYTFLASINGPSEICNVQGYYPYQSTITASPEIVYPLTYVWEISYIGVGNYTQVSTGTSWVLTAPSTLPGYWTTVRLTVTDAANHTAQGFYEIHRNDCPGFGGGGGDRSSSLSSISQLNGSSITATPNPASDRLTITGLVGDSQINVFDLNGRVCKSVSVDKSENGEIQVSLDNISAGIYFISIKIVGQQSPIKMRFVKL
jgi:hypothetical protein